MQKLRGVYRKLNTLFNKIDLFNPTEKNKLYSKESLKQKYNIHINLKEIGFKEIINDDDFKYETELWVYGDIEDIK